MGPVEGKPQLTQTEDILNSILPPREWTEEGQLWVQYVSSTPATRLDVINLQEQLDQRLPRSRRVPNPSKGLLARATTARSEVAPAMTSCGRLVLCVFVLRCWPYRFADDAFKLGRSNSRGP